MQSSVFVTITQSQATKEIINIAHQSELEKEEWAIREACILRQIELEKKAPSQNNDSTTLSTSNHMIGMDMYSTSAPSSGAWLALTLKVLENLGLDARKFKANPARVYHQLVEAFKYSYAAGSYLSDLKFNKAADKVFRKFTKRNKETV